MTILPFKNDDFGATRCSSLGLWAAKNSFRCCIGKSCIEMMIFVVQMVIVLVKMMHIVLNMMDFVSKMMNAVLQLMDFPCCTGAAGRTSEHTVSNLNYRVNP